MVRKFNFSLIKVEINRNTYNCSHESLVVPSAPPKEIPSRTGWLLWTARIARIVVFGIRVYLTLHGVDPDPVGLAVLGYGFMADVRAWIVERFTK